MPPPAFLSALLNDRQQLRELDEGVWSALAPAAPGRRYDHRAAAYDAVVGSHVYNRLLWGSSPEAYSSFAARAIRSHQGPLLDVGCGSLVFTAGVYARASRPLVLVDESIGMLHAARARLLRTAGSVPEHLVLLQADLRYLPFRVAQFTTVLCMGMLHLFADLGEVTSALASAAHPSGQLFLTSLIAETWIGARYLSLLHRVGEVAAPRTRDQLRDELRTSGATQSNPIEITVDGSMAFIVVQP